MFFSTVPTCVLSVCLGVIYMSACGKSVTRIDKTAPAATEDPAVIDPVVPSKPLEFSWIVQNIEASSLPSPSNMTIYDARLATTGSAVLFAGESHAGDSSPSNRGAIYVSRNGGLLWERKTGVDDIPANISGIKMVSDSVGWAIGGASTLSSHYVGKTIDGGASWLDLTSQTPSGTDYLFESILDTTGNPHYLNLIELVPRDASTIAVTDNKEIWMSANGGLQWKSISPPIFSFTTDTSLRSLSQRGNAKLAVAGKKRLFLKDSFSSISSDWTVVASPWGDDILNQETLSEVKLLRFQEENKGAAVVRWIKTLPGGVTEQEERLYRTINGGLAWSEMTTARNKRPANDIFSSFDDMRFLDGGLQIVGRGGRAIFCPGFSSISAVSNIECSVELQGDGSQSTTRLGGVHPNNLRNLIIKGIAAVLSFK